MGEYKKIEPDLSFVKGVMAAGGDTVNRCYQCATCSVVCPLSTEESPFPRKEMLWAQWGLGDRIAGDPDVWLCHQCADCTAYCPRGARPGDVLGAMRSKAIRHYSTPKFLADLLGNPGGVVAAVVAAMVVVLVVAGLWSQHTGHAFPFPLNEEGKVEYSQFLSVLPIDAMFLPLVFFVLVVSARGVLNFWSDLNVGAGIPTTYTGTYPRPGFGALIGRYLWPSIVEIFRHERFKKCGVTVDRARGHLWLLWSFLFLFIVTNYDFVMEDFFHAALGWIGPVTPLPVLHPVKLLANLGAVMLIGGAWMVLQMRSRLTREGDLKSASQDWILIWLILMVGLTGLGSEVLRWMNLAPVAYPVYVLHLGCVAVLFLSLPYTKFGHLLYRTTAYVHQRWAADVKGD
ncbi:heterodisulfide reductase [Dissulfurirhabdus thermomarina]|uniref:Heterodisulfide reductase n=1 Tax=Dissulfurirhabdus thermomarina TaxID=1765737 RepID=A0A6N9TPA6_DISTH|nr:quinone-interacting membrane-bound oxidoreductase complex subunit QmoC [Dissulfurirhabdus thermomarina]NDY42888.1 heterodisulfide reductase [Dissulfurirhabdus thermomarina]NMX23404.1 quinone-interacting membrane-bound oxidoreductase complex subunit QmoC [Dissulfurirhabdus thermomarina]